MEEALGKAIGWEKPKTSLLWKLSHLLVHESDRDKFKEVWEDFAVAARRYKKDHGRAVVLVLDRVDLLAEDEPRVLAKWQDLA
jgi:hypothetical protein